MPRGAKPGERRGGRKKGTPNKANADVRAAARVYTVEAIETLAGIMRTGESEQARVSAADKILDRAWGKAPQSLGDAEGNALTVPQVVAFLISKQQGADCQP